MGVWHGAENERDRRRISWFWIRASFCISIRAEALIIKLVKKNGQYWDVSDAHRGFGEW
jgi:hypothetical protein